MQELFEIAHCNALFSGIEADEFSSMLSCVEGTVKDYGRGELLLQAGDPQKKKGVKHYEKKNTQHHFDLMYDADDAASDSTGSIGHKL